MLPQGTTVVVGYSGGADSTCLLHLLVACDRRPVAAHLHHGQRPEADEEAKRCADFAAQLDVPFAGGRADVPAIARDRKIGLEEAGRIARYEFLREVAFRNGIPLIATAHTRQDHVETVLLHLARGAGVHGLAGIRSVSGDLLRPLLPFTREETRAYCDKHQLWFHDDPANKDLHFSRARIRHRILPELRQINPAFDEAAVRLAELCCEEDRYLDSLAAAGLERAEHRPNGPLHELAADAEVFLDLAILMALPQVIVRRGIRLASAYLGSAFDYSQLKTLLDAVVADEPGSVTAEGGRVVAAWTERNLHVHRLDDPVPFREPLLVSGVMRGALGWSFEHEAWPTDDYERPRESLEVVLDAAKCRGPLYARPAQVGDRLQPMGMEGSKHLSDVFRELRLTAIARQRMPVVCDLLGPIWVPYGPLAARVGIDAETEQAIRLRFRARG